MPSTASGESFFGGFHPSWNFFLRASFWICQLSLFFFFGVKPRPFGSLSLRVDFLAAQSVELGDVRSGLLFDWRCVDLIFACGVEVVERSIVSVRSPIGTSLGVSGSVCDGWEVEEVASDET